MKGHRVYIRKVPRKHTQRLCPVNCPQACGVVQRPGYKIRTNWRRGHRPDSLVVALINRQGAAPLKDRSPKHSSESISDLQAAFAGDELRVVALRDACAHRCARTWLCRTCSDHSRAVPSWPVEITNLPSLQKLHPYTAPAWPRNTVASVWLAPSLENLVWSQTRTEPSSKPPCHPKDQHAHVRMNPSCLSSTAQKN